MAINTTLASNGLDLLGAIYGLPGITQLITIGKAIGVAVLIYIIFLIIRSITQILYSLRFKKVAKNVEEINQKMDILIDKIGKEKKENKKK